MASPELIDWMVEKYQTELLRYAGGLLRDPHLAQDAVQHGFIELVRRPTAVIENPRAWLYRVVRNFCLTQIRNNKKFTSVEELPESPAEADAAADAALLADDDQQVVRAAVNRLRDSWKEVVILKFQKHLSYRQIAEVTGLSVSHVGVILHDALLELRRDCRKELES